MTDRENMRKPLARRPHGAPAAEDFRIETVPSLEAGASKILLKTLSLDGCIGTVLRQGVSFLQMYRATRRLEMLQGSRSLPS